MLAEPRNKYHATYFNLCLCAPTLNFLYQMKGEVSLLEGKVHSPAASLHLDHRGISLF